MNRRDFLAVVGVGAVEICVLTRAIPALSAEAATVANGKDPVYFKRFHGKSTALLIRSRKFRNFVEAQFPGVDAPFHSNLPLWAAVWSWMNHPGQVTTWHHRYVVATGSMAHFAPCRGMLWLDAKKTTSSPLVVFSFMNVVGPERELWIVANQNLADLPPSELPHHLTMTIQRWIRERKPKQSDGGLLTKLVIFDQSTHSVIPIPSVWGVKPYRCETNMVTQLM